MGPTSRIVGGAETVELRLPAEEGGREGRREGEAVRRRRLTRTAKHRGFRSMKWTASSAAAVKFQSESKKAPKYESRPALARVVEVVSKIFPPTLNLILSDRDRVSDIVV